SRRFLRSRGDAPRPWFADVDFEQVPPLTRRCTPARRALRAAPLGSSAHAEMHPIAPRQLIDSERFLRSRGDAPEGAAGIIELVMVPPLTRDAPLAASRLSRFSRCSSAHA